MNKKILVISGAVILLIALGIGGYFLWNRWKLVSDGNAIDKAIENSLKGVLPEIGANPLENKPDINPADKFNPFKNIKINPFK